MGWLARLVPVALSNSSEARIMPGDFEVSLALALLLERIEWRLN